MLLFDRSVNRRWLHGVDSAPCPPERRCSGAFGVGTRYSASGSFKYRPGKGYADKSEAAKLALKTVLKAGDTETPNDAEFGI